jgi:hypothetical protein
MLIRVQLLVIHVFTQVGIRNHRLRYMRHHTTSVPEHDFKVLDALRFNPAAATGATESFFDNRCLPLLNLKNAVLNSVVHLRKVN